MRGPPPEETRSRPAANGTANLEVESSSSSIENSTVPAETASEPFRWDELDPHEIVVSHQDAVGCYANPAGDVVLRQAREWKDDDLVVIPRRDAQAVAAAILRAAGLVACDPPKDRTAAERQRRYRRRKHTVTEMTVTAVTRHAVQDEEEQSALVF